jgi:hypothetical protein
MEGPEENKEKVIKDLEETRDLNQNLLRVLRRPLKMFHILLTLIE